MDFVTWNKDYCYCEWKSNGQGSVYSRVHLNPGTGCTQTMTSIHPNCKLPLADEWVNVRPMMSAGDIEAIKIQYCPSSSEPSYENNDHEYYPNYQETYEYYPNYQETYEYYPDYNPFEYFDFNYHFDFK